MTVLGYASTVPVTMDELLMLAAAVRRGLSTPCSWATCLRLLRGVERAGHPPAQRFVKEASSTR